MKHNSAWYFCAVATMAFFTCIMPTPAMAEITDLRVSVDKNPIMIDEAVQLIISAEGEISTRQIDLSMLEDNFRLSSTSISQSTRSINFNTTKTTTWVTQLFPKEVGTFTIPAFTMGGQSSKAFDIVVSPVGSGQGTSARDFYVTAEVDIDTVYLQQQIKYTSKLYLAKDIQRGSLQAPELENAIIKQVGKNKEYEDFQNGVRYRVIEHAYAIIPQASGTFSIEGAVFTGEALTDSRQSFGFINRTKPVNRVAPKIELTVLPIPDNYPDHWLPSEFVQLNEEWQQDPNNIVLGQPLTRTITLTAAGLVEEQLPEIAGIYPPDFKTYPDQATTSTVDKGAILFAQKIQSEAIIPNKVGTFVIGEVIVPWFNVQTKRTEYAKLPARSITVVPPSDDARSNIEPITPENQKPTSDTFADSLNQDSPLQNKNNGLDQDFKIDWLHVSLFLLWLASLLVFGFVIVTNKRKAVHSISSFDAASASEVTLWKQLRKALELANVQETNQTLTLWLTEITQHTVHSVNQCFVLMQANDCAKYYNDMMASLYGNDQSHWEAEKFIVALEEFRQSILKTREGKEDLFNLYPTI